MRPSKAMCFILSSKGDILPVSIPGSGFQGDIVDLEDILHTATKGGKSEVSVKDIINFMVQEAIENLVDSDVYELHVQSKTHTYEMYLLFIKDTCPFLPETVIQLWKDNQDADSSLYQH